MKRGWTALGVALVIVGLTACGSQTTRPTSQAAAPSMVAPVQTEVAQPMLPEAREVGVMHALMVIDSDDPQIGSMVRVNRDKMRKELRKIAQASALRLDLTVLQGKEFEPQRVLDTIAKWRVASNDVTLFYYAGHGFRYEDQTTPWPYLDMPKPLNQARVLELVRSKGARFNLVLSDACNNVAEGFKEPKLRMRAGGLGSAGYRKLFTEFTGTVAATSASPGEYSYAAPGGTWFTNAFLRSLLFEGIARQPSWRAMMRKATKPISQTFGATVYAQTPYLEMEVLPVEGLPVSMLE